MRFFVPALGALALLALPARAAVNLIVDGSFETNPAEAGGYGHVAGSTSFDGGHWFVTGVDILHVDTDYHAGANPPIVFNAEDGRDSLDLTGTGNSGPADGVYQDIATNPGELYQLSFFVGRVSGTGSAGGDYSSDATMRLAIDGGPISEFVNSDSVANGIAWKGFSTSFTAAGATTRIAFTNGLGNDYLGLDDVAVVSLAVTPEPATWALSLIGFGLIGVSLRRSKRRAPRGDEIR